MSILAIQKCVPEEIRSNPWLLFHGTSNIYRDAIEESGLQPSSSKFTQDEIEHVVFLFEELGLDGSHGGGYPVLKNYSLKCDFCNPKGKPIFLAESALRASLYASKEYAGGEVCRALHYSIFELMDLFQNSQAHNVDRLHCELDALRELAQRVACLRNSYRVGWIAAIKPNQSNLDQFSCASNMGVECYRPIHDDEIVGWFQLPADYEYDAGQDNDKIRALTELGIVQRIRNGDKKAAT